MRTEDDKGIKSAGGEAGMPMVRIVVGSTEADIIFCNTTAHDDEFDSFSVICVVNVGA